MKKLFALMSVLVIASILLATCGTAATPGLTVEDKAELSELCTGGTSSNMSQLKAGYAVISADGMPYVCKTPIEWGFEKDTRLADEMISSACTNQQGVLPSGKTYRAAIVQIGIRFAVCP